jgi:hypothetical protein
MYSRAPVAEGGLVNGAQLSRLHNGALSQLSNQNKRLEAMLESAMERLDAAETQLKLIEDK